MARDLEIQHLSKCIVLTETNDQTVCWNMQIFVNTVPDSIIAIEASVKCSSTGCSMAVQR